MDKFVYVTENIVCHGIKKREIGLLKDEKDGMSYIQFVNSDDIVAVPTMFVQFFNPHETGDLFTYKVCNRCNRLLPVNEFSKNQNGKNNRTVRRPSCDECRASIDGVSVPTKVKTLWDKSKPHMIIWECPICKKRTIPGLTSKVVLDHNHDTGEPRAWICDSCNTGLGRFKDDIDVMNSAIEYLKNK